MRRVIRTAVYEMSQLEPYCAGSHIRAQPAVAGIVAARARANTHDRERPREYISFAVRALSRI